MFEIGSSLREARERQKLELPEIERATHIRSRYLAALEEERFDVLPGLAYTKGFLRTYADYLGLDGQRFVDEYSTRLPPVEEPPGVSLARVRRRQWSSLPSRCCSDLSAGASRPWTAGTMRHPRPLLEPFRTHV